MNREEAQKAIAAICEEVDCKDAVSVLLQAITSLAEGYPDNKLKFALLATSAMIEADLEALEASGKQVPPNYAKANFHIQSAIGQRVAPPLAKVTTSAGRHVMLSSNADGAFEIAETEDKWGTTYVLTERSGQDDALKHFAYWVNLRAEEAAS